MLDAQRAVDGAHRVGRRRFRWHVGIVVLATGLASSAVWQGRVGHTRFGDLGGLIAALAPLAVSMVVGRFEAAATQRAASLQDEFDRVYLGLPLGLPLDKPNESIVANLRACSDTSSEKLARWYPDLEGSDPGTAALAIQRMNLTWDVAQRKWMTGLSISAGFCWFLTGLALWKQSSWTVSDFLLIWMGPAVAVWELSVTSAYRHYDLAAAKADLAEVADDGLKGQLLGRATALALADLIQAQMKELRAVAPRVPWFVNRTIGARNASRLWTAARDTAVASKTDLAVPKRDPASGTPS